MSKQVAKMRHKRKTEFLKSVPLFHSFNEEQMNLLIEKCSQSTFVDKQYVVHQGDSGDIFYIITSGQIMVQREDEVEMEGGGTNVTSRVVAHLMAGDFFGERALLQPGGIRAASCIAKGSTTCLTLDREEFASIMEDGLFTKDAWLWDDDDEVLSVGSYMHKFRKAVDDALEQENDEGDEDGGGGRGRTASTSGGEGDRLHRNMSIDLGGDMDRSHECPMSARLAGVHVHERNASDHFDVIMQVARELLGVRFVKLYIVDEQNEMFNLKLSEGDLSDGGKARLPVKGVVGEAYRTSRVWNLFNAVTDPRYDQSVDGAHEALNKDEAMSMLCVPVLPARRGKKRGVRPIAVLQALYPTSGIFTASDIDFIRGPLCREIHTYLEMSKEATMLRSNPRVRLLHDMDTTPFRVQVRYFTCQLF